jgi:glucose/arabinose dehydrogenase
VWHPATGDLWIVDSGDGAPDELNHVEPGGDYATRQPDFVFEETESHPAGIAFYTSEAIPFWTGGLLVAQRGSWDRPEPAGYAVLVVPFDDTLAPTLPMGRVAPSDAYGHAYELVANMSLRGLGFFPYHPVDVAVSVEGWIYVALQEGRILRFRPRPKANEALPLYATSHPAN